MSTEATGLPSTTSAPEAGEPDALQETAPGASGENTHEFSDTQLFSPVICYRDPADVRTIR
jgi:hypothetical protein